VEEALEACEQEADVVFMAAEVAAGVAAGGDVFLTKKRNNRQRRLFYIHLLINDL